MAHQLEPATGTPQPVPLNPTNQPKLAPGATVPAGQPARQPLNQAGYHEPAALLPRPGVPETVAPAGNGPEPMNHGKMGGHDHGAMIADFLRRFWICLALSVPVVAGSMMFQNLVGYHFTFPYRTPLLLGLASAIYLYGGWPSPWPTATAWL